jgi:hypothetical protein
MTAEFLDTVYGHGSGWVHLSTTKRQLAAVKCADVADLLDSIDRATDVYLSAAVIGSDKGSGEYGRIEDRDAAELTALWVDLDRAGEPGHKTKEPLWTREDIGRLWEDLPALPTAVVDSGGGWWFYYVLTEPVPLNQDGSGELLLARWARWWKQIGDTYGRKVDSVFNAGRICRAPGSVNNKNGRPREAKVMSVYADRTYSPGQLDELLPAPEAPRFDWQGRQGDGDRPGDTYNREATVSSMVAILESHGFHSPRAKGQRVDLTRPGKDARDGHSATVWPDASVTFWSSTAEGQPGAVELRDRSGASGTYDPFGLYVALEHRGDFEAAARALNPSSAVTVAAPPPADGADDDFWTARPALERIRTYAQAQMAAPHAVLAVVLARVVCQTPAAVVLPDIIYDFASLNLTTALVADSGGGKGGSVAVGAAAVNVGVIRFNTHTLGTGQGIAHGYAHHEKGETVRHADAVLFTVEEVDHLAAHNSQTGSTTLAELRRFGMGEKLGHLYVDPKRRIEIAPHSYRGAILVAVQPTRAGVILDAADGGTPQRFYWAPTIDHHPPGTEPERPEPWNWQPPDTLPAIDRTLRPITVCQTAADAIRQAQRDRRDGQGDPLDGHALLTRERLAAALGILDSRYEVNDEDWQLAGHLMAVSNTTRDDVVEALAARQREANRQRGKAEAERSLIVTEAVEEAAAQRVARSIIRHLPDTETVPRHELRKRLASRDRHYFDDAIERLLAAGQIEATETEHGTHYGKATT